MILLPYGLVEAEVHRTPWVSAALGMACIAVYFAGLFADEPSIPAEAAPLLKEAQGLHQQGSFSPGPACRPFLGKKAQTAAPGADDDVKNRALQAEALCKRSWKMIDRHPERRFAFVPARGMLQIGLISAIFLHGGFFHLLGNLLFFFVCGPFLEDLWGRVFFLAFFLVGGMGAALAQGLVDPQSYVGMVGASGAIAACMGALTLRYPLRHVKMMFLTLILLRPVSIRFKVKVWIWGGLWIGWEIFMQSLGGQAGVATMAHIGGFAVGAFVVLVLKRSGIEAKVLSPAVEKARNLIDHGHPEILAGDTAMETGRAAEAARHYESALRDASGLEDAMWGAARAWAAAGDIEGEKRALTRLARRFVDEGDVEGAGELARLHPAVLGSEVLPPRTGEQLHKLLGIKPPHPSSPSTLSPSPPSLVGLDVGDGQGDLTSGGPVRPRAAAARFAAVAPSGPQIEVEGVVQALSPTQVETIAVGMLASEGRLVVDLWMRSGPGSERRVLRMFADEMGLEHFAAAGASQAEVFANTMSSLLQASGAKPLPSLAGCTTGPFANFQNLADFERVA